MLLEKTISYGCLNGVVCLFYLTVLNLNPAIGKRPYNTLIWFLKPPSILSQHASLHSLNLLDGTYH